MTVSPFGVFLAEKYGDLKSEEPARRKRKLIVAQAFWQLTLEETKGLSNTSTQAEGPISEILDDIDDDEDIYDTPTGIGIVLRTDFSDDEAWNNFCQKLRDAEKEIQNEPVEDAVMDTDSAAKPLAPPPAIASGSTGNDADDMDEGDDNDPSLAHMFAVVDPPQSERQRFHNISNITALRLFNDVDIVEALKPSPGSARVKFNRLIDQEGYQEVYLGKVLWIYDSQSNKDQSARLVNQRSDVYGAATGDSWRFKVSFLPELQLNLYSGTLKIDFDGYSERDRNIREAEMYPMHGSAAL
ncbi:hypothetical protein BD410DRAFT_764628 [Rickenella mellea]|uniref:Uncharacterized protein n=1 Tax=Rickenella mellea TaxID=50990 RepID=A0A4Y7QFS4_9AGAM|nr:hypothetical protein BD410DRAFT_764628 [Rickenella mellea]